MTNLFHKRLAVALCPSRLVPKCQKRVSAGVSVKSLCGNELVVCIPWVDGMAVGVRLSECGHVCVLEC